MISEGAIQEVKRVRLYDDPIYRDMKILESKLKSQLESVQDSIKKAEENIGYKGES